MSSKIEQMIDEIDAYIENCKFVAFSNTDIRVNKEEIQELLRTLRAKTPDEIKRSQKIVSNKEAILNDAKTKAEQLIEDAKKQTNELIDENVIMKQAYEQANQVVSAAATQAQDLLNRATMEANTMKASAVQYTDGLLAEVERILQNSIDTTNKHYEGMLTDLSAYAEMVRSNRSELVPPQEESSPDKSTEADYSDSSQTGTIPTMEVAEGLT